MTLKLASIRDFSNAAFAEYEFDDAGRMTKKLLPNGLEVVYSYNDANWVTAITLRQTSNPSNVIQSFEYGYDQVGNRLWVRNADGRGDVYKYDPTYLPKNLCQSVQSAAFFLQIFSHRLGRFHRLVGANTFFPNPVNLVNPV